MAKGSNNSNKPNSAPAAPAEVIKDAPEGGTAGNAGDAPAPATPVQPIAEAVARASGDLQEGGDLATAFPIFRVSLPLSELVVDGVVNTQPLLDAVAAEVATVGRPASFPENWPVEGSLDSAVIRYAEQAIAQDNTSLESVAFVLADPETDHVLKSINFMRAIQGFPVTFFYPDVYNQE